MSVQNTMLAGESINAAPVKKQRKSQARLLPKQITIEKRSAVKISIVTPNKFHGRNGFGMNEVFSSVGGANVKIIWPDVENDAKFLHDWTHSRVEALDNNENVTLSYDSESVCLQFGDIFDHSFDILKWKEGDAIPVIKNTEGIMLQQYNQSNGEINNSLVDIIKPLLEHKKVTFVTFDFINDFEKLSRLGIYINTYRVIDCQMVYVPESKEKKIIPRTGWWSLKNSMYSLSEIAQPNSPMFQRALEEVKSGKKDFPWTANKFVLKVFHGPKTSWISQEFLEYASNDIFLTAVFAVNILITNQMQSTYVGSIKKLLEFHQLSEKCVNVGDIRRTNYIVEKSATTMQKSFSEIDTAEELLKTWNDLTALSGLAQRRSKRIRNLLKMTEEDIDMLKKKTEEIERIIRDTKMDDVIGMSVLVNMHSMIKPS